MLPNKKNALKVIGQIGNPWRSVLVDAYQVPRPRTRVSFSFFYISKKDVALKSSLKTAVFAGVSKVIHACFCLHYDTT